MIPTTYDGSATLDGRDLEAELHLDESRVRLVSASEGERINWNLSTVKVDSLGDGQYRLRAGSETFDFRPETDDGLDAEIALRNRFAGMPAPVSNGTGNGSHAHASPQRWPLRRSRPKATAAPEPSSNGFDAAEGDPSPVAEAIPTIARELTIADQIVAGAEPGAIPSVEPPRRQLRVGRRRVIAGQKAPRRGGLLAGGDLSGKTAVLILGALLVAVAAVGILTTRGNDLPTDVSVAEQPDVVPPPDTAAVTSIAPPVTQPSGTQSPATTTPLITTTTVAPTTTTAPSPTTTQSTETTILALPGTPELLEMDSEALESAWDDIARTLDSALLVDNVVDTETGFDMIVTNRVIVEATTDSAGLVTALRYLGDPVGPVDEDRVMLTAMGVAISIAAPDLDADGRRAMVETLGFDIADPDLDGLDGAVVYKGKLYALRWDVELQRIVLDVSAET